MVESGLIFWRIPFRAAGPRPVGEVTGALGAHLAQTRFGVGERMVGRLEGQRLRVWRKSFASFAGDVVEFDGTVREEKGETVIEGAMQYKFSAKVQFVGLLILGGILALAGMLRYFANGEAELRAFGLGALIFVGSWVWVYSSSQTKGDQIRYLEGRLKGFVDV